MILNSYGMGWDSTAYTLRHLADPTSRNWGLDDLVVVTAMTGDEFEETGRLVEDHILPRFRDLGIRYVQVARRGLLQSEGVEILDDTRAPKRLYLEGAYKLSQELKTAGTIPTSGLTRKCSQKYKGWVIDTWREAEFGEAPFRHLLGFNADEMRRVERDRSYDSGGQRTAEYPLVEWGWGREAVESYVRRATGVEWRKSCCFYCPFAGGSYEGRAALVERWGREPEGGIEALWLELVALALNPRMKLFASRRAIDVARDGAVSVVLEGLQERLEAAAWALYRVRRAYRSAALADRSLEILARGSRKAIACELEERAREAEVGVEPDEFTPRVWLQRKGETFPTTEELLVAAPEEAAEKESRAFATMWGRASQLSLWGCDP